MHVLLAGGSGLIGTALRRSFADDGHRVSTLVRRPPAAAGEYRWDPGAGRLDAAVLDGVDAVICLSGAGVGDHRWTAAYKTELVESRVRPVATLARAVAEHGARPLLAASAVGYYGDPGDRVVDEQDPPGDTFLAGLCVRWEAAAEPARAAGGQVTHLRTGIVLSRDGGLLQRLRRIVLLGAGGRLGSGRQYVPWISLTDEIRAIRFALDHQLAGPVDLTAPEPVRNAELTRALGRLLHRPTVLRVPGFATRVALGEFSDEVLIGQRALPTLLLEAGFAFRHVDLEAALRAELT